MKTPLAVTPIVLSILFSLAGFFTIIVLQVPSKTGLIGGTYYSQVLIPFFGHGAGFFGLTLIVCAVFLAFSRYYKARILALSLILLPVLIWIDTAYVTETFPAISYINSFVTSTITIYIGDAGLLMLELIFLAIGLSLLLYKVDIRSGIRKIPFKKSHSEEPLPEKLQNTKIPIPEVSDQGNNQNNENNSQDEEPIRKPVIKKENIHLNLKPYRKTFNHPKLSDFKKQPPDSVSYGEKKEKIKEVFASLGVKVNMGTVIGGPSVEQYEIIPGKGVKLSQIRKLDDDLSLALKSKVLITFNTKGALCVEAPIAKRRTVYFRRLLETSDEIDSRLPVILGVNASYETYGFDLAELPHLLIAGTTGSGKSILVKTILASIMYKLSPNDVRLVLVDPKRVDFGIFNASPFLAHKVITDMDDASEILKTLVDEMERRYDLLEASKASNIAFFNQSAKPDKSMPYIVAVIDEFADLIMGDTSDIGENIIRIAQKARACGIHLILATQRPSAEVINGLIKANVPGKIALSVSSSINSKIIIDRTGAEKLLGKGDMIFISPEVKDGIRLQGAFISDDEIMKFMK
jgi:DNA segregation ATPase FtsK/SpoIIIE-like protein